MSAVGVLFSWRMAVTLLCLLGGSASMLGRVVTSFAVLCMVQDVGDGNGTSPADGADSVTVSTGRERKEAECDPTDIPSEISCMYIYMM